MFSKLKINTALHRSGVFVVGFDHSHHISIVYPLLTLNKYLSVYCQRQVIMFSKHIKVSIFFIIKVARPISFSDSSLHQIEINYDQIMRICFSFKIPLGIPSVLSLLCTIIWSAISSLFPRHLIFLVLSNQKTYLNHWNSEANEQVLNPLRW